MHRLTGLILILMIVVAGFAVYIFDSRAENANLNFEARNLGTGTTAALQWVNPDMGLVSIDLFQSTDKKNNGQKIKRYEDIKASENTDETVTGLTPRRPVYFSLIGNKKNGQQVYLGQTSIIPVKYPSSIFAAGQTPDRFPVVGVFDKNGNEKMAVIPFGLDYRGAVALDRADFDGDGQDEVIVAPTDGLNAVKIYRQDGSLFAELAPYEKGYDKGLSISRVGFYNYADGDAFLAVAPRDGADPQGKGKIKHQVKVYRYDPSRPEKFAVQAEFTPFEKHPGGITLSAGDVNGDGHEELIATPIGGIAEVRIFNLCTEDKKACVKEFGSQAISKNTATLDRIFPYGRIEQQDIQTTIADLDNDGVDEIIISPLKGRRTLIKVYSCQVTDEFRCLAKEKASTQVYNDRFQGGVRVTVGEKAGSDMKLLLVTPQQGGGPHVKTYRWENGLNLEKEYFAYEQKFNGGVATAIYRFPGDNEYLLATIRARNTDSTITLSSLSKGSVISKIHFPEAAPGYYLEIK